MDILNEDAGVSTYSVDMPMTDIVNMPGQFSATFPKEAIRNRAATSALLQGDPNKVVDSYQMMLHEADNGDTTTHDNIVNQIATQNKNGANQGVLQILGDRNIPLDQKRKVMSFVQQGQFKEEPSTTLQSAALAAPSKGEDIRGEAARISTADILGEMEKERQDRQKLVNGAMAQLPSANLATVGQMAAAEVLPFGRNIIAARVAASQGEKTGAPVGMMGWIKNFLTPGSTKADLQAKLMAIPPQNREAYTKSLLASIQDSAAIFHSDNYFAQYQTAMDLLDSPAPSSAAVWAENVGTLLDAYWVADIAKGVNRAATVATKGAPKVEPTGAMPAGETVHPANWELVNEPTPPFQTKIPSNTPRITTDVPDATKRITMNSVVHRENPMSPYNVVEQVNPAHAREMHQAIIAENDEFAKVVTGVDKEQALANNTFPQAGTDSGAVLAKVNQEYNEAIGVQGALRYTSDELHQMVSTVTNDFRGASGMEINDAMTIFRTEGDHIFIDAHYAPVGGSWTTPEAAREQAQYALRKYGVQPDEITVMSRSGVDYVPATGNAPGDYIVKVKSQLPLSDLNVQSWSPFDVKRNWADRISWLGSDTKGSVAGSLFDPSSMLHPSLTSSATVAEDQAITFETILLSPIKTLRDSLGAMPTARRVALEEYFKEANMNGIKFDPLSLSARGFSPEEIDAARQWRDIWDSHYYLENHDLVRTTRNLGYQVLDNGVDKFFAKPIPKNKNIGRVYDPTSGQLVNLSPAELDDLYNKGGTYAALRRPVTIQGEEISHIMSRQTPQEYLRGIRDTDAILNYREGYYTVNYKSPKFIDEVYTDASGKEARRTVGVAATTKDADMFANSRSASTGNKHEVREDIRGFRKDGDGYWDLNAASGRIAQRQRGQPLNQAIGVNNLGVGPHIENPMESAVRAAKSLAGRTITRPVLETAKARFVEQYSDFLKDVDFGKKSFPGSRSEIVDKASHTSSRVADARTTYDYINFLENGYINTADEVFKGGMNVLADMLGKYHLSTGERAARTVGDISITHGSKATVFNAYVGASNPVRQWIVQAHQVTRTMAYNPIGWSNGGILERITGYLGVQSGLVKGSQVAQDFERFVNESGMVAGVDRNSLVRGMSLDMADSTYGMKRYAVELVSLPQRVGFDLGEKMNQLGHLAAVHEKYVRQGANMADKTVRDSAMAEARALSYDLNKAGELHYTQGSFAAILQFLQMPQKAMLQLTNRRLPLDVRLRMAGWDLVMWGLPTATIAGVLKTAGKNGDDILPDDPDLRDMYVAGVESYALNHMFSLMDDSGEKTRIDFSALKPNDLDGWAKMMSSFMDKGMLGTIASSPAGQIMAVDGTNHSSRNGRIPQAILTMGRFFNVFDEIDPENPTAFKDVLNDVAKISSGWTAAANAKIMLETRKKFDQTGTVVDGFLTDPEIAAAFLGFGTMDTKALYEISQRRQEDKKKHEEDVMSRYRDITRYYSDSLSGDAIDVNHIQKVTSMLMRTFTEPGDMDLVYKQFQRDLGGKDTQLFQSMMKAAEMPDANRLMDDIKMWPVDQAKKDAMMQYLKDMRAQREFNKGK